ncbi:MAG: phosphoglucosamine mutase [Bacteroidota bacterium]
MALITSVSGVRGIVGKTLTPDVVVRYASAFAEQAHSGPMLLGRDGRPTGRIIANIVSSTLISMGSDVTAIGVCPTPTLMFAAARSRTSSAVAVTASHNPTEWNGLKFIGAGGMLLTAREFRQLSEIAASNDRNYVQWQNFGKHVSDDSYPQKHLEAVLAIKYLDVQAIRARKFTVVVDCINGAGAVILPDLLRKLGCTVIPMNCDLSGIFTRPPEPVPENLTEACQTVLQHKADLGIVVDPDADRLALITEQGHPFGEEFTVVGAIRFVLQKESNPGLKVAVNLSTTRAVEDVAHQYGAEVYRTPVGEVHVADKMKEVRAVIGGEGNGGVILPALHYGRDSLIGVALMLQYLTEFGGLLSQLKQTLPVYSIAKDKVSLERIDSHKVFHTLKDGTSAHGRVNTDDGLKLDFPDYWVHLRKSNTEPIIRIICEARTQSEAEKVVKQYKQRILSLNF